MRTFQKPPLTAREQLDRLVERGLVVRSTERAQRLLESVTLFRLTPYMRPFQHHGEDHRFTEGSTLRSIVEVYRFDSELRQLLMVALERVEVAMRATLANYMSPRYGAHWYLERDRFAANYRFDRMIADVESTLDVERKKFERDKHHIQRANIPDAVKQERLEARKRDNYPRFYAVTYDDPCLPPFWAVVEEMTLGAISHLYRGIANDRDRKAIASRFNLPHPVLGSWLHTLTAVRNICAHHSRLWNRELGVPPQWPRRLPEPGQDAHGQIRRRLYTVTAILTYLTARIAPDTEWVDRLADLFERYPDIPRAPMGFPEDWRPFLNTIIEAAWPSDASRP